MRDEQCDQRTRSVSSRYHREGQVSTISLGTGLCLLLVLLNIYVTFEMIKSPQTIFICHLSPWLAYSGILKYILQVYVSTKMVNRHGLKVSTYTKVLVSTFCPPRREGDTTEVDKTMTPPSHTVSQWDTCMYVGSCVFLTDFYLFLKKETKPKLPCPWL